MELLHPMIGLSSILNADKLLFREVYLHDWWFFHAFSLIVGMGRFYFFLIWDRNWFLVLHVLPCLVDCIPFHQFIGHSTFSASFLPVFLFCHQYFSCRFIGFYYILFCIILSALYNPCSYLLSLCYVLPIVDVLLFQLLFVFVLYFRSLLLHGIMKTLSHFFEEYYAILLFLI